MSQTFTGTQTLTIPYGKGATYHCTLCDKWYERPAISVSCCVLHSGGCCHYGETEMNPPTPKTEQ